MFRLVKGTIERVGHVCHECELVEIRVFGSHIS